MVRGLDTPGSTSQLHLEQGVRFGANRIISQSLGSLSVSGENLRDLKGWPRGVHRVRLHKDLGGIRRAVRGGRAAGSQGCVPAANHSPGLSCDPLRLQTLDVSQSALVTAQPQQMSTLRAWSQLEGPPSGLPGQCWFSPALRGSSVWALSSSLLSFSSF